MIKLFDLLQLGAASMRDCPPCAGANRVCTVHTVYIVYRAYMSLHSLTQERMFCTTSIIQTKRVVETPLFVTVHQSGEALYSSGLAVRIFQN